MSDQPSVVVRPDGTSHFGDPFDLRNTLCGLWIGGETWTSGSGEPTCGRCRPLRAKAEGLAEEERRAWEARWAVAELAERVLAALDEERR